MSGVREPKLFIDGEWRDASSDQCSVVVNPADERDIARVPEATSADMETAILAARRAFDEGPWGRSTVQERARVLAAFVDVLERRRDEIVELTVAEAGCPRTTAAGIQVKVPLDHLRDMVDRVLVTFPFRQAQQPTFGMGIGQGVVLRESVGVVAAITPFNYPFFVNASKLGPALAAGNTVVLKPSPYTPLAALLLAEAAEESGLPKGVLNVVTGGVEESQLLTGHPAVDMVTFTGSPEVGAAIMRQAATGAKRVLLELGGKSANIVLDDADLSRVAPHAVSNFTRHAGQGCACFTRILVHESRHDELVERMVTVLDKLVIGDPSAPSTDMGPLIRESQRGRVEHYVAIGREEGAKVAFGGGRPADLTKGFFVEPTLFTGVDNKMRIAQEEIFGPVGVVIPVTDDAQAVAVANDSPFGLSGSVWSGDPARAYSVAARLRTGVVTLNGGGGSTNPYGPFGGYKLSGVGREFGEAALGEYLETKTVNWGVAAG